MIGKDAFCPESGATLSRERYYDERGRTRRAVDAERRSDLDVPAGKLTNGEVRSSGTALVAYFRRSHERHAEPDPELYRRASLAIHRLKEHATGRQEWDVHVWYALKRRLDRRGHAVDWMDSHAALWCPHCHSRLYYRTTETGTVLARCGVDCQGRRSGYLDDIRDLLATLYGKTFTDEQPPDPEDFLTF